ncbi:MAG: hypothetical protein ACUVYA_18960, partial [Planctomycetota bacterium]
GQVRGRTGTARGAVRPAVRPEARAGASIALEPEGAPPRDYPVELRPNRRAASAQFEDSEEDGEALRGERPGEEEVLLEDPVSLEGSSEGAGEAE